MRVSIPKSTIRTVQRAIVEFELLEEGDRVLLGLSGGKDSIFLLHALSIIMKHVKFKTELFVITIDLGFKKVEETDYSKLHELCASLQVPFKIIRAELGNAILNDPKQSPCARCSYFRRAIIHNYAQENNFNKVAFAHHLDDAVETFLLSILYSGQVRTFRPKTYLDRTDVTVIRPLVYLREKEIKKTIQAMGIEPMASPCPLDGKTKRTETKELISGLRKVNPHIVEHLTAAMREGRETQFWPRELTNEEIRAKSLKFWAGDRDVAE